MHLPRRFGAALLTLLLACAAAGNAVADTISRRSVFGVTEASPVSGVSLPQFDPALGTLFSIRLFMSLNGDLSTFASQDNSVDEFNIFHDAGSQVSVTLTGPDASITLSGATPLATGFVNAGKSYTIQTELIKVADQVFPAIAGAHNPYVGTGKVDFTFTPVVTTSGFGNGPGLTLGSTLLAAAKVDLAYIYLPVVPSVPEPGTWARAGLGLAALWAVRRRA